MFRFVRFKNAVSVDFFKGNFGLKLEHTRQRDLIWPGYGSVVECRMFFSKVYNQKYTFFQQFIKKQRRCTCRGTTSTRWFTFVAVSELCLVFPCQLPVRTVEKRSILISLATVHISTSRNYSDHAETCYSISLWIDFQYWCGFGNPEGHLTIKINL